MNGIVAVYSLLVDLQYRSVRVDIQEDIYFKNQKQTCNEIRSDKRRLLESLGRRWEYNIKMDHKEIVRECVDWVLLLKIGTNGRFL